MVMGYRMTWMFVEDPRRRVGAQGVRRRKCKTEIHARVSRPRGKAGHAATHSPVAGEATRKSSSRCTSATTACSTEADDLQGIEYIILKV
nr:uncharacterized protein LOC127323383 isoform X3 [Lolium perenne]